MPNALLLALATAGLAVGCGGGGERADVTRPGAPLWCPTDRGPGGEPLRGQRRGTFDARLVLGREEAQGRSLARGAGCEVRVMRRDGEELAGILNLDPRRIDVAVEDGVIVEVLDIG